ncbi:DUF3885 domain-containing protein [Massilia sp.]
MDVLGRNASAPKALHDTHNAWLVDHDRATMDACVKPDSLVPR